MMGNRLIALDEVRSRPDVVAIQSRTDAMVARAEELDVVDEPTAQEAADFLIAVKTAAKNTEDLRKTNTQPLLDSKKRVYGMFKQISLPCGNAEKTAKEKLGTYRAGVGSREKIHGTNGGTVSFKQHSSFRIVDPEKVPKKYWCIDEKLLGEVVRGGVLTEIPGVEITEGIQVDVRT